MERVKGLFSRNRSTTKLKAGSPQLRGYGYNAAEAHEAPIMGTMPVAGNAPRFERLQQRHSRRNSLRQSFDTTIAALPSVRLRTQAQPEIRPTTAPSSGSHNRTWSGFSSKGPPDFTTVFARKTEEAPSSTSTPRPSQQGPPSRSGAFTPGTSRFQNSENSASHQVRSATSHVDLFDAVSVRSGHAPGENRMIASGRRDFGEDIADRNISDFGSGDINLNSPQYSYLKNFYKREAKRKVAPSVTTYASGRSHDDRPRVPPKSTPTPLHTVQDESSLLHAQLPDPPRLERVGDNTAQPAVYGHSHSFSQPRPSFGYGGQRTSSLTSTTSRDFHYPTNTDRARTRSLAKSPPPAPHVAAIAAPLSDTPVANSPVHEVIAGPQQSRRASISSIKSYIPRRGRSEVLAPNPSSASGHLGKRSALTSQNGVIRDSPAVLPYHITSTSQNGVPCDSPTVLPFQGHTLRVVTSQKLLEQQSQTYSPLPPLPVIDAKHLDKQLPTPPVSPPPPSVPKTASPTKSAPRRKPSVDSDYHVHSRSRGSSANYTIFPQPSSANTSAHRRPISQISDTHSIADAKDIGTEIATRRHVLRMSTMDKRNGMLFEGSSEPVSLDGVVDLTNTVDTDTIVTQQPAVIHEHVLPTVHYITEERIIREIHTHDVFHRILPVIDVEVLPTKHYVLDPLQPGTLKEIPAEHISSTRQNNWQVTLTNSSANTPVPSEPSTFSLCHRSHERRQPILSSKKTYVTKDGYPRTEYVWRHPPVLEPAIYDTTPLAMSCVHSTNHTNAVKQSEHSSGVHLGHTVTNGDKHVTNGLMQGKLPISNDMLNAVKRPSTIRDSDGGGFGEGNDTEMLRKKKDQRIHSSEEQVTRMMGTLEV